MRSIGIGEGPQAPSPPSLTYPTSLKRSGRGRGRLSSSVEETRKDGSIQTILSQLILSQFMEV
jgi:hypothetical protein